MTYANIRIDEVLQFGSDDDDVSLAPLGTPLPEDLTTLDPAFVEIGLLAEDGLTFSPSDSVEKRRGHQGHRVYKTIMTESDTDFSFIALQSNLQTLGIQWQVLKSETKGGFSRHEMSNARTVDAYAIVIRAYANGHTYLWACDKYEIGERSEFKVSATEDTAYSVSGTFITNVVFMTDDPAFAPAGGGQEADQDAGNGDQGGGAAPVPDAGDAVDATPAPVTPAPAGGDEEGAGDEEALGG